MDIDKLISDLESTGMRCPEDYGLPKVDCKKKSGCSACEKEVAINALRHLSQAKTELLNLIHETAQKIHDFNEHNLPYHELVDDQYGKLVDMLNDYGGAK